MVQESLAAKSSGTQMQSDKLVSISSQVDTLTAYTESLNEKVEEKNQLIVSL